MTFLKPLDPCHSGFLLLFGSEGLIRNEFLDTATMIPNIIRTMARGFFAAGDARMTFFPFQKKATRARDRECVCSKRPKRAVKAEH